VLDGLARVVADSVAIKGRVVAEDRASTGAARRSTSATPSATPVELAAGYRIRHGEAVALGMVAECDIAERVGVARAGTAARVRAACVAGGLPVAPPRGLDPEAVLAATRSDKKARAGRVEYALPADVGAMADAGGRWSVPVDDALVLEVLTSLAADAGRAGAVA
jgi:3-dehydroquinate synthetase